MIAISVRTQSSLHPQIFRCLLAAVFKDVEGNLAAFDKAIGARLLNGLDMHKHILAAAIRRNKAATLRDVEPLDSPARHLRSALIRAPRRDLLWRAKFADEPRRSPWQLQRINLIAFQTAKRSRPLTVNRHHQHHQHHQATAVLASPRSIGLTHAAL
jgi:hypothetical protein